MADLLDEFDNPEIPTNRKGFFESALSGIDKPSNAMQGLFIEGLEGAKKGWNQERNYDYEELYTDEFRKNNPEFSYYSSGLLNLLVDPLNFIPLGMLAKGVKNTATTPSTLLSKVPGGSGVDTVLKPIGYLGDKALAEMPNRLEYFGRAFYEGGPVNKAVLGGMGFAEGLAKTLNRELNPAMIKRNKIARELGIPTTTLNVVDDVLQKINDPQLQATIQNLSSLKNPTKKQAKMIKDYNNLGKILQGQLGWNYLEKEAYGLTSALGKYKNTHFLSEGLDLTKDNFVKGAKEFNNVIDEAYHLSDDVLGQVWDRVARNQKIANPEKHKLYFKTPAVSNANATRLANEAASGRQAAKRGAVGKLFEKGKPSPFKDVRELQKKLREVEYPSHTMKGFINPKKETVWNKGIDSDIIKGKDGKEYLMFSESYLSSDNLLGGVNQVNLLSADGKIYSFVNDAQDLFSFKFPKGQTPIVVTPGLVGDFTKAKTIKKRKLAEPQVQKGMMLGKPKAGSRARPILSPQLKKAAEDIQRIQKEITLNPLDYLHYAGKVNLATSPYQD